MTERDVQLRLFIYTCQRIAKHLGIIIIKRCLQFSEFFNGEYTFHKFDSLSGREKERLKYYLKALILYDVFLNQRY